MKKSSVSTQRGASLLGMIFIAAAVALAGIVGVIVVGAELEHQSIKRAVNKASQELSPAEARSAYDRAANVDGVESLRGSDLEFARNGDKLAVRYAYERQTHLIGPAYLTLKYAGQSK